MSNIKKNNRKITILSIVALLIIAGLCFMIYLTFFANSELKKLGYNERDILLLEKYNLKQEVSEYNPSLIYALSSNEFKEENIEYYLALTSDLDLTRVCNQLAKIYSIKEINNLKEFLSVEEIEKLTDHEKISSTSRFKTLYQKGYDLENSLLLTNALSESETNEFVELALLSEPANYLTYLENGFDSQVIDLFIDKCGEIVFNNFTGMKYHEKFFELLSNDYFQLSYLPRYLMYLDSHSSDTVTACIGYVNADKDVIKKDNIDYSSYYKNAKTIEEVTFTTLVNKQNQLPSDYIPNDLVEVDSQYRYNNQPLVEKVASSFIEMADDINKELGVSILAYNNYLSYVVVDSNYQIALTDSYLNEDAVATYMFKAGCDEHQTGLAVDIAVKGSNPYLLEQSQAYSWLLNNSYLYGFIQRYPENSDYLTGIQPMLYQFRYVGSSAAKLIHQYNWTLEEYSYIFN